MKGNAWYGIGFGNLRDRPSFVRVYWAVSGLVNAGTDYKLSDQCICMSYSSSSLLQRQSLLVHTHHLL